MNWPYTGEHNISRKVLYYAHHICHHYSQYLVTATRFMWPWGTMKEAWSNLMWVMIVSDWTQVLLCVIYTMQHQRFSIASPRCATLCITPLTGIIITLRETKKYNNKKMLLCSNGKVLPPSWGWPKYLKRKRKITSFSICAARLWWLSLTWNQFN